MTSRIHRGFHRIGIVLAMPVLIVALGLASHEVWRASEEHGPWENYTPAGRVIAPAIDMSKLSDAQLQAIIDTGEKRSVSQNYTFPLTLLGLALALYVVARAVGWVLDGFVGSDRA